MTIESFIDRPDGRRLRLLEQGEPDAPAWMYLHGLPGAADEAWLPEPLAGRVRLLSFDRPGFGGSTPCPDYTLAMLADDISAIADARSVSTIRLLGFSAGGLFALACAGRIGARVARVVSVGAPALHWLNDPDREAAELTAGAWQGARDNPEQLAESLTALTGNGPTLQDAMRSSLSAEDLAVLDQSDTKHRFAQTMAQATRHGAVTSASALARELQLMVSPRGYELGTLPASVCFLHGDSDQLLTVRHLEAFHRSFPQSEAVVLPGQGHYSPLLGPGAPTLWADWMLNEVRE
ncbi:alpha/beta hydrolase [Marinimicrobium sp. C6131]|uniref:alpha/beta fold hydrolase n=1 Tax=Marinimicrobium sp. C6131 TaxID=3022676 RepID=UPI00223D07D3|nr:alpha/beta fold hydrolase [Marinimicrobium sp. C6131]UZJ44064.1 alpha/beta hydrolase [Marinimicrobium sp. C6131]